ncbi:MULTISPECIES: hypothetical protein [Mumia]|uniref:hypothetical protein n=1 Tax=Mumia TaxID=1546255 RepID=UPI0014231117|nr:MULTISPECIES: hypothetical protein [unclassified Mumia]QMW65685.1 hypothetical protein H4N58_16135 [Mumia sp. ZJ1417]
MKRHPLDALTLVSLTFVAVAGAVWGMWYAGWDLVSIAIAGPLLLVLLGVAGLVATFIAARQTSRRNREQRTAVSPSADTTLDATPDDASPTDASPANDTRTLTLEDLTGPSDEGDDKR